jgi:hypothetical protein
MVSFKKREWLYSLSLTLVHLRGYIEPDFLVESLKSYYLNKPGNSMSVNI